GACYACGEAAAVAGSGHAQHLIALAQRQRRKAGVVTSRAIACWITTGTLFTQIRQYWPSIVASSSVCAARYSHQRNRTRTRTIVATVLRRLAAVRAHRSRYAR